MASAVPTASSRPSSNPRDSPFPAANRQKSIPNGLRRSHKAHTESDTSSAAESNTPDQHSHDRLLFLSACAVGCSATITTIAGEAFAGVFSGASLDKPGVKYVLKMTKKKLSATDSQVNGTTNAAEYVGYGTDHIMMFDPVDVALCTISGLQMGKTPYRNANGTANSFRTDTDISAGSMLGQRELKPWDSTQESSVQTSLNANGHATEWDQFEANERLYGVTTDYDEEFYTTALDRTNPTYKQRAAAADRKAREIETATNSNVHRVALENETDEEERFAGVRRDTEPFISTNPNSYKPPARRAPTAMATVPGAPVDPAIISSQLARPDVPSRSVKSPVVLPQSSSETTVRKENIAPSDAPQTITMQQVENLPTLDQAKSKAEAKPDRTPVRPPAPIPSPGKSGNVADTVEKDVYRAFKDFSAHEKMRMQEKQRNQGRKEREVKINDLKKFASNFKLSKPVPDDLIGILAKDKKKQDEIIAKAHREAEQKKAMAKPASSAEDPKAPTPSQPEATKAPIAAPVEPSGRGRGQGRGYQSSRHEKYNGSFGAAGAGRGMPAQSFGARKMQQYPPGAVPSMTPIGPAALQTDLAMRQSMSGIPSSASSASRFNAHAMEFRPNPTASTFSPSANPSSMTTSQAGSRPVSKAQSPNKTSFFEGTRPSPLAERPSIRNDFNPIKRMKNEAQADGKSKLKDFEANDGIQPAYYTRPTWDVRPGNEERNTDDIFKQQIPPNMQPRIALGGMIQNQIPPHLQPGPSMMPHIQGPNHNQRFGQPSMQPGHQHQQDAPRMQYNHSQSGNYNSPRPQYGMMAQQSPMPGQPQPYMGQPGPMYVGQQIPMGYARPASATPQMINPQTGQPVMMVNGPPNQYMPGHQPHMQMYSPAPGQAYPTQGGPGTPSYSPRAPPMMMQQSSQQGHTAPMMYMSQSQQGQPMYFSQPPGQPMAMRGGGYPMQPQNSYGASPHVQPQYPMQHRGPQQFGNFPQQQMHPQAMAHPNPPHGEVK